MKFCLLKTRQQLTDMLNDRRLIKISDLLKLSDALDVSVGDLCVRAERGKAVGRG